MSIRTGWIWGIWPWGMECPVCSQSRKCTGQSSGPLWLLQLWPTWPTPCWLGKGLPHLCKSLLCIELTKDRLSSGSAKPKTLISTAIATTTAISREISYVPLGPYNSKRFSLPGTQLGRVILVLSNVVVVLVLCFYGFDTEDQFSWEDIGYRIGFVAVAQLPLVFLLAAKQNIIGTLTGFGYERLNWLHRWTARTLWFTVTLHMSFWFRSWARYDYIKVKVGTDPITQKGLAAWCILTFILFGSFAPVRRWNYELFVLSHLILFAGFIGAVYIHVPDEVRLWVWIPIGLYFADRLLRASVVLFSNLTIFHWSKRKDNEIQKGFWANKATLTMLPGGVTRISINKPAISWKPGQHVFLACHSLVPLQSHPFSIASLPSDDKMEFLVRAERGGTKRFLAHAKKTTELPSSNQSTQKHVAIEGPYGKIRDLNQFDSVVFFAGSNGATFTVPLMRSIVQDWMNQASCCYKPSKLSPTNLAITRRIRFVWVLKSGDQLCWFAEQLDKVLKDISRQRGADHMFDKEVEMTIYVTCDDELVAQRTKTGTCAAPKQVQHGAAQELLPESELPQDTKEKGQTVDVKPVDNTALSNPASNAGGCNADGTCCCKTVDADDDEEHICTCTHIVRTESSRASQSSSSIQEKPDISRQNPPLKVISGRPHPRTIIRKVLEEAEGESAVIVCGPRGLNDDVRSSVVSLSDERAVHKGSGAQGIYLHVEGFDY